MDLDKLERLASLRDSGAITDAEFEAEKAKLLGQSQAYEPSYYSEEHPLPTGKIVGAALAVLLVGGAAALYASGRISLNDTLSHSFTLAKSADATDALKSQSNSHSVRKPAFKPARFFVGERDQSGIDAVRANTSKEVIAGHYSLAEVSCGTGCMSDYLVDRNTGGVIGLPVTDGMDEGSMMFWSVHASKTSDVLTIIYGPATGLEEDHPCEQRRVRVSGTELIPLGDTKPLPKCPDG